MEAPPATPKVYTLSLTTTRSIPGATVDVSHIWRWLQQRGIVVSLVTSPSAGVIEVTCFGDPALVWLGYDCSGSRRALAKSQVLAATNLVGIQAALVTMLEGKE